MSIETEHSYEDFTQRAFYREIDAKTAREAPMSESIIDICCGTGAMTDLLIENGRLANYGKVLGVDSDPTAVKFSKEKFKDDERISLEVGDAENLLAEDESFDLAIFGNAIHLTQIEKSIPEAYRVLKKGGFFIISSAYVSDIGYPGERGVLWRNLGMSAIKKSMKDGNRPEKPKNVMSHSSNDYEDILVATGFKIVHKEIIEVEMDKGDVSAICSYDEFAKGALPGIPVDKARGYLLESIDDIFSSLNKEGKKESFPRGWLIIKAQK